MGPVFIGEILFPHTSSGCCYRARGEWSILQLLTQAPVETFHKPVLHWLSRLNARPADTGLILPFQEGSGGEFGAVVAHDCVRLAIEPDQVADPDLRDLMAIQHVQSCGPAFSRTRQPFPNRSFRMELSSIWSARRRFSLAFSCSSTLSRRASETPMPSYLAFHL